MQTIFSAVSPRLFEAALAGTCQILIPAKFLGVLRPDEHYIPLAPDFSNIDLVRGQLTDWGSARERAEACRSVLLYRATGLPIVVSYATWFGGLTSNLRHGTALSV